MVQITFRIEGGEDVTIFAASGENLLSVARKANVVIDAPCSGNGSCGKCKVRLVEGEVTSSVSRHITPEEEVEGWRLACACTVSTDAVLFVPDIASAFKSRMKVADLSSAAETAVFNTAREKITASGIKFGCGIRVIELSLNAPSLDDTMPDNERLVRAVKDLTGRESVSLPFAVLRKLPGVLRQSDFSVRAVISEKDGAVTVLDVLRGDDTTAICGLAADIGTTTVSGLLVSLEDGAVLAKASAGNGQIRYGADVINRIIEQGRAGGVLRLKDAVITETLIPLIECMCFDAKVPQDRIYKMTVASNTTMNHLFLGIEAEFLRMEPYIPAFFESEPVFPRQIGLEGLSETAQLYISPNIGSYVGGDITAGVLAGLMWDSSELTVFIDLGTNGEIVFGNRDFMMACACSAGPAFEGGDISCGMRATDGAIEACVIDSESMEPEITVIGGVKPVGLCGSGIIDVISELFRCGIINGRGKFVRDGARVLHDEYGTGRYVLAAADESGTHRSVTISEVDIDNFIRAKGAIFSAIVSLIEPLGFTASDIERVMVAGGIGSGINIKSAVRIGMLPDLPIERFSYIGNSSLTGAYEMLVSEDAALKLREIGRSMTYLELSTQPGYMDSFVAACFLPHTDETLFPSAFEGDV